MTDWTTERIAALLEPLTALHAKATPGRLETAEIHEEDGLYECPFCSGSGAVEGEQFINYDERACNVLFSGIGDEFGANRDFYRAISQQFPDLVDALRAVTAERDAAVAEVASMRESASWFKEADIDRMMSERDAAVARAESAEAFLREYARHLNQLDRARQSIHEITRVIGTSRECNALAQEIGE